MPKTKPSFVISDFALFVINLDDAQMQKEVNVTTEIVSKTRVRISGTAEDLSVVLDDLLSRGSGRGWDQPSSFTRSAKRAYDSAVKQLTAAGFTVVLGGMMIGGIPIMRPTIVEAA